MTAVWIPASLWQPAELDWQAQGVCARAVAEAFPEDRRYTANKWWPIEHQAGRTRVTPEVEEALRACNGTQRPDGTVAVPECPVLEQCLEVGMAEREGVWGGLLPEEREAVRRRRLRQARKQHREAVGAG